MLMELARAAAARLGRGEVVVAPIGGGVAVHTGAGSPANKLAGLGFGDLPPAAELEAIEEAFALRHAPLQVEFASLGDPVDPADAEPPRLRAHRLRERARPATRRRSTPGRRGRPHHRRSRRPGRHGRRGWTPSPPAFSILTRSTARRATSRSAARSSSRFSATRLPRRASSASSRGGTVRRRRGEPQNPSRCRAARRGGHAARPSPAGRADGAAAPSPARRGASRLRRRGRHDAAGIEVDGERAALRIRGALRARDPLEAVQLIPPARCKL